MIPQPERTGGDRQDVLGMTFLFTFLDYPTTDVTNSVFFRSSYFYFPFDAFEPSGKALWLIEVHLSE